MLEGDGDAELLYREAKLDPSRAQPPKEIAARLPGCEGVFELPGRDLKADGEVELDLFSWRIVAKQTLAQPRQDFVIAHEIAEWHLSRAGKKWKGSLSEKELRCDVIARALLVPRPALRTARRYLGDDFPALARHFATTEAIVALRYGEGLRVPMALIGPRTVDVRGDAWGWPEGWLEMQRLARLPAFPGLRRAVLRDERAIRVVLFAERA